MDELSMNDFKLHLSMAESLFAEFGTSGSVVLSDLCREAFLCRSNSKASSLVLLAYECFILWILRILN